MASKSLLATISAAFFNVKFNDQLGHANALSGKGSASGAIQRRDRSKTTLLW